jgi:CheY-like chemotaxis protein
MLVHVPNPDVRKEFGAAVRKHRQQLGLSQETLAERAELHRTYITDVERGARNLSLESISKLARALEISIGSLFFSAAASSRERAGKRPAVPQPVDLLLVEDDSQDLELTLKAFKKAKLANHIDVVRDGAEALDYLFRCGNYAQRPLAKLPTVVLLDLHLPKVDGMEVLRRIKADKATRKIHVIVLTGSRGDEYPHEALRLGAEAYIVKPVDFQNFSTVTPQLNCYWTLVSQAATLPS